VRFLVWVLAWPVGAQTLDLPGSIVQGKTLRIRGPASAATARMGDRTVRMFAEPGGGTFGLMPIAASEKTGAYRLDLLDGKNVALTGANLEVVDAHFPKQNVTIQPNLVDLQPSPDENESARAFRKSESETRYWSEPLAVPVSGRMTSAFGVARYLNGTPTGDYHGGLDQRAPAGTPIHAVAGGVVKIVRAWNLRGGTVGIDHGQGLESMYMHMSRFAVAEGATVQRGDVIGYSGSTGRSTAPHLHWMLYVHGVLVNPADWVHVPPCSAAKTARKASKK